MIFFPYLVERSCGRGIFDARQFGFAGNARAVFPLPIDGFVPADLPQVAAKLALVRVIGKARQDLDQRGEDFLDDVGGILPHRTPSRFDQGKVHQEWRVQFDKMVPGLGLIWLAKPHPQTVRGGEFVDAGGIIRRAGVKMKVMPQSLWRPHRGAAFARGTASADR